jgi:ceramide glucosyltransferase
MAVWFWMAYAACCCVAAGGVVFYGLTIAATRRYRAQAARPGDFAPPLTILKPLAGLDDNLEENLATFFEQDYPRYQILFAVRRDDDPAVPVVRRLLARYPQQDAELLVSGEPPFPNAKVYSLARMAERARYDILVISDSDIRADRGCLRGVAAEFADPQVGVITCPYRAVPGDSFWSRLEALTLNTEFWCGVVVAKRLEGMHFAVGPTMALRRLYLEQVGGFPAVGEYLAEDFVLGQWAASHGYRAELAAHVVDHCIGSQPFGTNLRHRIRWARSTRRSRPWGYVGQIFTNPLPFAMIVLAGPAAALGVAVVLARVWVAGVVAGGWLRDPLTRRYWWLVPVADVASLLVWILGFFGNTVEWRGRRYDLLRDGRFRLAGG